MNIPCDKPKALCTDDSNPFENLSSEGFDGVTFIARYSGSFFPPMLGGNGTWTNPVTCESTVSQEEADLCAFNKAVQEAIESESSIVSPLVYNNPVNCTRYCADGLPFTYFVNGGIIAGRTQQEADATAHNYACTLALRHMLCLSNIPWQPCLNSPYDETITVRSYNPATVSLVAGSLPPGLEMETTADGNIRIFGSPTQDGEFEFTLYAENESGDFMYKPYLMAVGEDLVYEFNSINSTNVFDGTSPTPSVPVIDSNPRGFPKGIEWHANGSCSGILRAEVSRDIHPDPQAALEILLLLKEPVHDPVLVRLRGTARNGYFYRMQAYGAGQPVVSKLALETEGDTNIDVSIIITPQGTVGITSFLQFWWGVKPAPSKNDASIELTYTISKL